MDIISIQKFSNFIIKALPKIIQSNTIASFAFRLDQPFSVNELSFMTKEFEKSFYWEKPLEKYSLVAFGELVSVTESGKGRFAVTEKKIRVLQNSFISNCDEFEGEEFPLFVGGMKFSTENEKELWENYADSNWFIPHILIVQTNNKVTFLYNFLLSPKASVEKLVGDFQYRMNQILKMEKKQESILKPSVIILSGNASKDKKKWMENVKRAIDAIESDKLKKVVLSRKVELELNKEPDFTNLIDTLRKKYSECYLFIFHSGKSSFFGASPEKLIKLNSGWIETDALAGSAPRGGNELEDKKFEESLINSTKDQHEHNSVKDYLLKLFSGFSDEIYYEEKPQIKKINNIQHLWTPIRAKLNSAQKIFSILENIHPTPAVCGYPKTEALNAIKKLEEYPRGLYAGIIGWFNFSGEGEFTVAIRSALLKGKKLHVFAGGGIVEGSDPALEFKETELKLKPIFSLFENES